jgi:two-component system invasion response regulator UvrY
MLTIHTENPLPAKVMQAGASGYLSKGAAPQEVVNAIRSVHSGQRYIASDIAQQMALSQIEPEKPTHRLIVCLNVNCRLC